MFNIHHEAQKEDLLKSLNSYNKDSKIAQRSVRVGIRADEFI